MSPDIEILFFFAGKMCDKGCGNDINITCSVQRGLVIIVSVISKELQPDDNGKFNTLPPEIMYHHCLQVTA